VVLEVECRVQVEREFKCKCKNIHAERMQEHSCREDARKHVLLGYFNKCKHDNSAISIAFILCAFV